jgi:hypothetical protein
MGSGLSPRATLVTRTGVHPNEGEPSAASAAVISAMLCWRTNRWQAKKDDKKNLNSRINALLSGFLTSSVSRQQAVVSFYILVPEAPGFAQRALTIATRIN